MVTELPRLGRKEPHLDTKGCCRPQESHNITDDESRRDLKEGGELDSQEEASPEEIKRREVRWTLTKEASPEEIKRREVVLGLRVGLLSLQFVSQRRSYGHCLCDSVLHSNWDSSCVVR